MSKANKPPSRERVSQSVRQWASSKAEILNAWLYGSRIRGSTKDGGEVRPDSDWDVAVELKGASVEERDSYWIRVVHEWSHELAEMCDWDVHLEHFNPPTTVRVTGAVDGHGVLVYTRNVGSNRRP